MRALKTEDRQFTSNPSQHPSSSRRMRSSQASSELSSSEECLVAEKMEKKGKENEAGKKRETGELKASLKIYCEVIDVHLLQTEAYICSEKEKLQNNMEQQNYSEGRKEKNKKWSRLDQNQEQTIFAMHSDFRYDSENSLS